MAAEKRKEHEGVPHEPGKMPEGFEEMGDEANQGVFDDPTLRRDEQSEIPGKVDETTKKK